MKQFASDLRDAWNPLVALDDPYPVYRRLRDEAPVYHYDRLDLWALSRFDDVQAAAKDWETFSTSLGGSGDDLDDTYQLFLPAGDMAGVDPPVHTRLRSALRLAFSPSALRTRFEPIVRRKVIELIGLISNSLLHLDRFPDQRELIRNDLSIIPAAIEELLRFDAPIQTLARTTTRDVAAHDRVIPEGARVALVWASANRDERRWVDPDRLDISRPLERHVSFGDGIHHCLGAPLARLEARIVLEELFERIPAYAVSGPIVRIKTPTDRGLESLRRVLTA